MNDALFHDAFFDLTLPAELFDHQGHIRLAFIVLSQRPFGEALTTLRDGIRAYATHLGAPEKYHETITVAFASLVNAAMAEDEARGQACTDGLAFAERHPELLDSEVLYHHYDRATLHSEQAKHVFLLPRRMSAAP
ncbi:MAG: hypothetical protein ACE366_23520 [Bradymonadia bacterium]